MCRRWKMMSILDKLNIFGVKGIEPGTYKFDGIGDLTGHRFHLRVDPKLKGVLMVDASRLLFLNGTALEMVRCMLEGKDEDATVGFMRKRFSKLDKARAHKDYGKVRRQLLDFVEGDDNAVKQVSSGSQSIGADDLPSPYRMDLALTYKCQNECGHCYNEDREVEEMPPERWSEVIDRLWEIGIPHIVFTGGEPTTKPFLKDLIAKSEANGQITGLITNGRQLREEGFVKGLVVAGLDHVQITVLSHKESAHDTMTGQEGSWSETVEGLKTALAEDLYVSTNTTIMSENIEDVEETMRFLIDLGVRNISFNGIIRSGKGKDTRAVSYSDLEALLQRLITIAEDNEINLVWYTPTPYCELNPLQYGLGIKQCTACSLNMAIEPDGSVLPCQSYYEPLGNILKDDWSSIWDHKLCGGIRSREYMPEKCAECELAQVCGGGCPLSLEHGDYVCLDRASSI
jgi:radical SAM protein with 4Fe4S-binding SPASM domain